MKNQSVERKNNAAFFKRGVSVILICFLAALTAAGLSSCENRKESFAYLYLNGVYYIVGTYGDLTGNVSLPSSFRGEKVAGIYSDAFSSNTYISSVVIPEGYTSIGSRAFYNCLNLNTVVIPSSLEVIAAEAFSGCRSLTAAEMPAVSEIGDFAFAGTALTEITLPATLRVMGSRVFSGASELSAVNVNENGAFSGEDGVLYDKEKTTLLVYPAGKSDASFTLPSSVAAVSAYAFENAGPASVSLSCAAELRAGAFAGCAALTSLSIPETLVKIDPTAFNAPALSALTADTGNPVFSSDGTALYTDDGRTLFRVPENASDQFILPDGVTKIGGYAFRGFRNASIPEIPSSVTEIGAYAFAASLITSAEIPDNVQTIGSYVFLYCASLTRVVIGSGIKVVPDAAFLNSAVSDITLPEGLKTIGTAAFGYCKALRRIELPESLVAISDGAFYPCPVLSFVILSSPTPPELSSNRVFTDVSPDMRIVVPDASLNEYKTRAVWSEYASRIIPASQYDAGN